MISLTNLVASLPILSKPFYNIQSSNLEIYSATKVLEMFTNSASNWALSTPLEPLALVEEFSSFVAGPYPLASDSMDNIYVALFNLAANYGAFLANSVLNWRVIGPLYPKSVKKVD